MDWLFTVSQLHRAPFCFVVLLHGRLVLPADAAPPPLSSALGPGLSALDTADTRERQSRDTATAPGERLGEAW